MPYVHIDWVEGQGDERRDEVARRVSRAVSEAA
jgi:phenylpyruvate tautomerase PptA (4-oxalocrotonate tautomerase family)